MAEIIRHPRLSGQHSHVRQRIAGSVTAARNQGIAACEEALAAIRFTTAKPAYAALEPMVRNHEIVLEELKKLDPSTTVDHQEMLMIQHMLRQLIEFWDRLKALEMRAEAGHLEGPEPLPPAPPRYDED